MTTMCRYRRFKRIGFYAGSLSGMHGDLTPGCHILFALNMADGSEDRRLGRVLAVATHDGDGKAYKVDRKNPMLAVLMLGDNMRHAYVHHIHKDDVRELVQPGAFLRWFLFGEACSPETAESVAGYGAMSESHIAKFLSAPEGAIHPDWFERGIR